MTLQHEVPHQLTPASDADVSKNSNLPSAAGATSAPVTRKRWLPKVLVGVTLVLLLTTGLLYYIDRSLDEPAIQPDLIKAMVLSDRALTRLAQVNPAQGFAPRLQEFVVETKLAQTLFRDKHYDEALSQFHVALDHAHKIRDDDDLRHHALEARAAALAARHAVERASSKQKLERADELTREGEEKFNSADFESACARWEAAAAAARTSVEK